jgi:DNA invertase Pin-like site-specific DNA recombinase
VSTTDQDTARQHAANRTAAAREGWVTTEYSDDGLSASMFAGVKGGANRADYRRMLTDITAGQLDLLVVHDVSRASRELEGWAPLLGQCRRAERAVTAAALDGERGPCHEEAVAKLSTRRSCLPSHQSRNREPCPQARRSD